VTDRLRILHVEDSEADAKLVAYALRRGFGDIEVERVSDATEMIAALQRGPWHAVVSDWRLPNFSAPAAFALAKKSGLDIPFIVVSGADGEEAAADATRVGANDYVLKDNLPRLVPAIQRELREAELRRERH